MSSNFDLRISARTLPSAANAIASARSSRPPTIEPRIVIRFMTTSKIGVWNSPGGSPTRLTVPLRRTSLSGCANAAGDTAVASTPSAPPAASFATCARRAGRSAVHAPRAPRRGGEARFPLGPGRRHNSQPQRLGLSPGRWAKPADPGDGDPLAGLRLGLLDALVASHAGT